MTYQIQPQMNWQERLNEHEETAPQDTWEELRQSLELDRSGLREKMLALESEPPATVWSGIRESLEPRSTPLPRLIPFFRRHAATAGIAASLLLVIYVYQRSSNNITSATASVAPGVGPINQTRPSAPENRHIDAATETRPDVTTGTAEVKPNPAWSSAGPKNPSPAGIRSAHGRTTQNRSSRGSNYIEICDEKGECDRLTYKLETWVPCLNASCSDAEGMRAEKARKIEAWRTKLEHSTYVPAAGHFFDIGEMAQLLQSEDR